MRLVRSCEEFSCEDVVLLRFSNTPRTLTEPSRQEIHTFHTFQTFQKVWKDSNYLFTTG